MSDIPDAAVEAAIGALDAHRWKSMGVASVECECGEIIHGDASLTRFPADEAFRRHLASAVIGAAAPRLEAAWRERRGGLIAVYEHLFERRLEQDRHP